MKSRISFFDQTVFRKDLTRFAPVWGLYLISGLLVAMNLIGNSYCVADELMSSLNGLAVVNLLYAALCAQMLFGDLFNSKLCNALHALPLRRETWFITHTVAGLAFSVVPNLILSLCFMLFLGELWFLALLWLLGMTLEFLFFFGVAALSCMLSGSRVGAAAVYAVIHFLSAIVYWFVFTFYEPLLPGLHIREKGFMLFCPVAWMVEPMGELAEFEYVHTYWDNRVDFLGLTDAWWYLAAVAVLGIAVLALGVFLYRRRRLECAGDLMAFKPMEPVFAVIATLSCGAVFQIMGEIFDYNASFIYLAVGIFVGWFASRMLLERRVKVFRKANFFGFAAVVAVMGLTLLITAVDPLGLTRWVPEPEDVASVTVADEYLYHEQYDVHAVVLENRELIETVVQAHGILVEEGMTGDEVDRWNGSYTPLTLIYEMKDGRQVRRHYYYPSNGKAAEILNGLLSDPAYVLGYLDWDKFVAGVTAVEVDWQHKVVGDEARALVEAVYADCKEGTMVQNRSHFNYVTSIRIIRHDREIYLDVFEDCAYTMAWIKKNIPAFEFWK